MNNYLNIIPELHPDSKWEQINESEYFLYNETFDSQMTISPSAFLVLGYINGINTIKEITNKLTENNPDEDDYRNIIQFICTDLKENNILVEKGNVNKESYILLNKIVISENITNKICNQFTFLFHQFSLVIVLSGLLVITSYLFTTNTIPSQVEINPIIVGFGLLFLILAHEFGHCTAIRYRGLRTKGIGFGFYFIFPVFFAEVTQAWTLPHRQRLIIDLGGFYFQFIITSIYFIIAILWNNSSMMNLVYTSVFLFIFNINPFIKSDFYWAISDYYNIPNFHNVTNQKLLDFFKRATISKKNIGFILFGFFRYTFLLTISILIVLRLFNSVQMLLNNTYIVDFWNIERDLLIIVGIGIFLYKTIGRKSSLKYVTIK